ncbi:MAG: hypothetical protein JWM02_513 [Frankiales bacterium]|nr:hypothetical protein [Frankiales bacterium]
MTYHCPLCGLRVRYASELDAHARDEHLPIHVEERKEHITRYRRSGRPKLGPVYIPL